MPKVATVLGQGTCGCGIYMLAVVLLSISVVSLPGFVYNVLLQRVSFAQYVTKRSFLKITTQQEIGAGSKVGLSRGSRMLSITRSSQKL